MGKLVLQGRAKLAVGCNSQTVDINGSTVVTAPGGVPAVSTGGLLALASNIGHYERDACVVIPEFGLQAGYQVTSHLRAHVGYTFLYWPDLYRPGSQIDLTVNSNLIPPSTGIGPQRPAPVLGKSDVWVQGLNVGFEFRY